MLNRESSDEARTHRWQPIAAARLTPREAEVVALIAAGLTDVEIAEELVIAPGTVRTYVKRCMRGTGATTRAHLVIFAFRAGLAEA